ncbi:MAG TPA: efflux RND transporter periplasmic adaptor subunit [Gemmataceae bacterium]|nr:efflux RND transporter periplasmic adaptor subunit [Gemmataceae bacterium]
MSISKTLPESRRAASAPEPPRGGRSLGRRLALALRVLQVRLRFFLVLIVAFVVVGKWDTLRNHWDRMTRGSKALDLVNPVSVDTEYYCPMCPGVLSDWPTRCPVCNMALVRRKRGDMTPLPDGVLARMQFSPARLQLGNIKTSPLALYPLVYRVDSVGTVEAEAWRSLSAAVASVTVKAEVFAKDVSLLAPGQRGEVTGDALVGREPLTGKIKVLAGQLSPEAQTLSVWLDVTDPEHLLRPAMVVNVRIDVPATQFTPLARAVENEWRNRVTVDVLSHSLVSPEGLNAASGVYALLDGAMLQAMFCKGLTLAVPESAVIDTGTRKVVYAETAPGQFDGLEVVLGPRCGDLYPVIRGLSAGQRVATTGAFLIDADTQLNRSVAATYFGAARGYDAAGAGPPPGTAEAQGLAELSAADRALALRQKLCPVTDKPLGSMGTPTRVEIGSRIVFLCCEGCEAKLKQEPDKYLSKLHVH